MKWQDVELQQVYLVKVSGNLVPVRIDNAMCRKSGGSGWYGTNLKTGRQVSIKTAGKLRRVLTYEQQQIYMK